MGFDEETLEKDLTAELDKDKINLGGLKELVQKIHETGGMQKEEVKDLHSLSTSIPASKIWINYSTMSEE